jgi:putative acetyltransferase
MSEGFFLDTVKPNDFPVLLNIWEESVRETHHFLKEENIQFLKPLIGKEYLGMVDLTCSKDPSGKILGFIGTSGDCIEMLFIHPSARGKGIGKTLVVQAIKNKQVNKVDVNEQNEQALGFYLHLGFKITGRSEVDRLGKPFPLLHLEL